MVTRTAGRRPAPSDSTTASGIRMPVAVLPLCRIVVRNRISRRSHRLVVEVLQEPMGCELDLLVAPLSPEMARDDARPMHSPEIAEHECVPSLGLVCRPIGQTKVPCRVVIPCLFLEEAVLIGRCRLRVAPVADQDVLPRVDETPGVRDGPPVQLVASHGSMGGSRMARG